MAKQKSKVTRVAKTKAERIAEIIANNAPLFSRGTSIDYRAMVKLFSKEYPQVATANIKDRLSSRAFLAMQAGINRVLKHSGRAIKWKDDNTFLNVSKKGIKQKAEVLHKKAENCKVTSMHLIDGLQHHGNKKASNMLSIVQAAVPMVNVKVSAVITGHGPERIHTNVSRYIDKDSFVTINNYK
jgi:hypothetical protein